MGGRRVAPDVGEVQIQSHKNPIFLPTGINDFLVGTAAETFFACGMGVVACPDKE